jgi:hypothetical protein
LVSHAPCVVACASRQRHSVGTDAVGLRDMYLGVGMHDIFGPIHTNELRVRRVLNDSDAEAQGRLIGEFLDGQFDLAGVVRE